MGNSNGGGAKPGRPARSVDTTGWITFANGQQSYLGSDGTSRNDLKLLAGREGMDIDSVLSANGWRNATKPQLIDLIRADLKANGAWVRGVQRGSITVGSKAAQTAAQPTKPKPQEASVQSDDKYPHQRFCPNPDHAPIPVGGAEDEFLAGTCPVCGLGTSLTAPKAPKATKAASTAATTQTTMSGTVTLDEQALAGAIADGLKDALRDLMGGMQTVEVGGREAVRPALVHHKFEDALEWLQSGQHIFLTGERGTGKSHLARQLAEAMGLAYEEEHCTPGMFVTDLKGYRDANGVYAQTKLHRALQADGMYCLDEIDNGDTQVLGVLNSLMSEGMIDFPDGVVRPGPNFRIVATANTYGTGPSAEYIGRVELDNATLNRFAKVFVPIDPDLEDAIVRPIAGEATDEVLNAVRTIRQRLVAKGEDIKLSPSPRDTVRVALAMKNGRGIEYGLRSTDLIGLDDLSFASITQGLI